MIRMLRLAVMALLVLWCSGCKDEPPSGETVDRSQLCKDGGGALQAATNECVCTAGQRWTGMRCEAAAQPLKTVPQGIAPNEDAKLNADGSHESAAISLHSAPAAKPAPAEKPAAKAEAPEPPKDTAGDPLVAAACAHAKGEWLEMEGYCYCERGGVLVGQTCRRLRGNVTDDACLYAVHKGKWNAGDCECPEGMVFAPNRGGCAPRMRGDVTVLRRECESTLNGGKWDAAQSRCRCPEGRIWLGELCQVAHQLSSGEVCESEFNGGKWDYDRKKCACPTGRVWLDRTCMRAAGLSPKKICESENGGGKWNELNATCACEKGHWDAQAQSCR